MLSAPLIVVGANKGGVGKTTVARALIDYFLTLGLPVKAYDTQSPGGGLKRYYPDITDIVNLKKTRDLCRFLEEVNTGENLAIVDACAGQFSRCLTILREVGFTGKTHKDAANVIALHVLGSSFASLSELEEMESFKDECEFFNVRNFISDARYQGRNQGLSQAYLKEGLGPHEILIPPLDPLAYEAVDTAGVSFSAFVLDAPSKSTTNGNGSFVLRGYVGNWLERVWNNFESAGLNELVSFAPNGIQAAAKGAAA